MSRIEGHAVFAGYGIARFLSVKIRLPESCLELFGILIEPLSFLSHKKTTSLKVVSYKAGFLIK